MTTSDQILETMEFFSVTKFVNYIIENKLAKNIKKAKLYYKGTYTFKNKFNDMCVKPIYLILFTDSKPVYINHEKILCQFDAQPVISFKTNKARRIPEGKQRLNMFYLTIDFKQQVTKEGFKYYPLEIHKETDPNVVDKINSLRIETFSESMQHMSDCMLLEDLV